MILFKDDWEKPFYKNAIIDYDTRNKTFVDYVGILEAMGVQNRFFPLALVHPELKGVNPHDPDLDNTMKTLVAIECKTNPWYFFREIIRVPAQGSSDPVMLQGNRGNFPLWWLFFNHVTSLLIQPRQTGKSLSSDCLMAYLLGIATVNTKITLLTKDDNLRGANVARLKDILDEFPPYLKLRTKKDTNNTETITINALGNIYNTALSQQSTKAALNVGRGITTAIVQVDELPFCYNIDIIYAALMAATSAARDTAAAIGAPYGTILTTTPGYMNTKEGQYARQIYDDSLPWNEKLYDCKNEADLYNVIRTNNKARLETIGGIEVKRAPLNILLEFNHRQLGKTDEWLLDKLENARTSREAAEADFLLKWPRGSTQSPIPQDKLETIANSRMDDNYTTLSRENYMLRWYVSQDEVDDKLSNRKIIVGIDSSEGVGRDSLSMVFRDTDTGEVLMVCDVNETNVYRFGKFVLTMIAEYPNTIYCIERRNMGVAIIDYLLLKLPSMGIDPFKRLFNWVVNDCHVNETFMEYLKTPPMRRDEQFYTKVKQYFGYATSGSGTQSRDNLYRYAFNSSIKYTSETVRDKKLIDQLCNLIYKNERIDHKPGQHDDLVIGWLLAYWFLLSAINKDYYGLTRREVLTRVQQVMLMENGSDAMREKMEQQKLKDELLKLKDSIKQTKNRIELQELVSRFDSIAKKVKDDDDIVSIDEIRESLYEPIKKKSFRNSFLSGSSSYFR